MIAIVYKRKSPDVGLTIPVSSISKSATLSRVTSPLMTVMSLAVPGLVERLVVKLSGPAVKILRPDEPEVLVALSGRVRVDGREIDLVLAGLEVGDDVAQAGPDRTSSPTELKSKMVVAGAAGQHVVTEAAGEQVVAGAAVERIGTGVSSELIGERGKPVTFSMLSSHCCVLPLMN